MVSLLPLQLCGATAHMRGKKLVGPVDYTLEGTGLTMVIGPNGAGKTTFLRLMHGLQRVSGGELRWAVSAIQARQKQAFVFQTPIMMRRKVLDSLAFPLLLRGMGKAEARSKARQCARRFGLKDLLDSWAPMLSGGEKQRLSLARALIIEPEVLFLDEPCANLDGSATREIEGILQRAKLAGTRIVMASHDMGQARRLADEVIFFHKGRVHENARAGVFFSAPVTREARAFINGEIVE